MEHLTDKQLTTRLNISVGLIVLLLAGMFYLGFIEGWFFDWLGYCPCCPEPE